MNVNRKLLMDADAVDALVDVMRVQPHDTLVIVLRDATSKQAQEMAGALGQTSVRYLIIQIPENGEVLVVRGNAG